jgi:YesN/AraC family two-component response regulator
MKAIIVDDEENAASLLKQLIENYHPEIEIKAVCSNAKDALLAVISYKPEVVFLDIIMPDMTGLEFFEKLSDLKLQIHAIITTAHPQHGYYKKAVQLGLADFLLKPIIKEELSESICNVKARIDAARNRSNALTLDPGSKPDEKVRMSTGSSKIYIRPNTILYAIADGKCSKVVTTNQQEETVMHGIGELAEMLSETDLCKIDRFTIVNRSFIHKISPRLKLIFFEFNGIQTQLEVSHIGALNLLDLMDSYRKKDMEEEP